MASVRLVRRAKAAAKASAQAAAAQQAWIEAFKEEFGHDDISDILIDVIESGRGDPDQITAAFIDENSKPGMA
ncbi:hypothetical protein ACK32R_04775 [Aeromonas dhakensis]|jgi:hypothetical protein|uniref:hypothetical protein n=1 Tax=Aeromonas dhakensis TaxID=196024 RepID=UPI003986DF40